MSVGHPFSVHSLKLELRRCPPADAMVSNIAVFPLTLRLQTVWYGTINKKRDGFGNMIIIVRV